VVGSTSTELLASGLITYRAGSVGYKIATALKKGGKGKTIATALGTIAGGLLAYTTLEQKVKPEILEMEKKILNLCPCDVIDLENERKGM